MDDTSLRSDLTSKVKVDPHAPPREKGPKEGFWSSIVHNAILMYEIRLAVRSRAVLVALCLYLLGQCLVLFGVLSMSQTSAGLDPAAGANLATAVLASLFIAVNLLLCLFSVSVTLQQGFDEMICATPLGAKQVARGKFASGILFSTLFYAATLPFLTVAWMLRGVDIVQIGAAIVVLFCTTQVINFYVMATFVRCRTKGAVVAGLLGLAIASPPLAGGLVFFPLFFCVGAAVEAGTFSGPMTLVAALAYLPVLLLAYSLAAALFAANWDTKESSDRFIVTALLGWVGVFIGFTLGMLLGTVIVGIVSSFF